MTYHWKNADVNLTGDVTGASIVRPTAGVVCQYYYSTKVSPLILHYFSVFNYGCQRRVQTAAMSPRHQVKHSIPCRMILRGVDFFALRNHSKSCVRESYNTIEQMT